MSAMMCPVCGEELESVPERACPECGALLDERAMEKAKEEADERRGEDAALEAVRPRALSDEETDELLAGFRDQFERHEVRLPKAWVDRLRRLATETEASRRQATMFFVDLRGYTRLSQILDDVQLDRLRQWFYDICTRRVELHGGFIIQFLGDAAYAAFGAPWAFERDAESALLALIDIRDDVRRQKEFEGHELAIRAGADTGIVNVRLTEEHGRPRPDLFGSPVNLAARLEAQSDTWEILISDTLADQVRGVFELEQKPGWTPKNYGREVVPSAVLSHKGDAAQRRRDDLDFVGREPELTIFNDWVSRARSGEFVSARVSGEAGIGKTRLVREAIMRQGSAPLNHAIVGCEPHDQHILLGVMLKLMRHFAQRTLAAAKPDGEEAPAPAELTPDAIFAALAGRLASTEPLILPNLGYILGVEPHLGALRGMPARQLREQTVASLVTLIESVSRADSPWLIFLDDAQWADPLTWEVVAGVMDRRPPGLLLIVAGRKTEDDGAGSFGGGGAISEPEGVDETRWEQMRLEALPPDARRALLAQLLDIEALHPVVRRRLLEESEGIPLYMMEMAREIGERPGGEFEATLRSLEARGDVTAITSLVIDLLQARIDKLSRQRRALLQCGAALGRRFDLKSIKLFESMHEELLSELYSLKGLRMLRDEPLPDNVAYYFTPTLLRDVAYRMLTPEQKTGLHRTVAREIEKRFSTNLKSFSYELAFHWLRAGEPSRARPHLRRAAQRAMDQGVPQEAYDLSRLALEGQKNPAPARADDSEAITALQQRGLLEEIAGKSARLLGDYTKADEHFRTFGQIASLIANGAWRAQGAFQLAVTSLERGAFEEAERLLDQMPPEAADGEEIAARARNVRGIIRLRTGRPAEALDQFLQVAADTDGKERLFLTAADAWNNAGLARWQLGEIAAARDSFSRALAIWQKMGHLFGQASTISNMGIASEKLGRLDEAAEYYARASEIAERIGYIHGNSAIEANRSNLSLLRRDWIEAQEQAARALHAARLIGHRNSEAIGLENLGLALGGLGQVDEALAALERAAELGVRMGDPVRRDSARLACASVALHNGHPELAGRFLDQLPADISPELATWRETLARTLEALSGTRASVDEFLASLDQVQTSAPLEDYLRRLDALSLLADLGRLNGEATALVERRKKAFAPA